MWKLVRDKTVLFISPHLRVCCYCSRLCKERALVMIRPFPVYSLEAQYFEMVFMSSILAANVSACWKECHRDRSFKLILCTTMALFCICKLSTQSCDITEILLWWTRNILGSKFAWSLGILKNRSIDLNNINSSVVVLGVKVLVWSHIRQNLLLLVFTSEQNSFI